MTTARRQERNWPAFALFWVVYLAALAVVISPDSLRTVAPSELDFQKTVQAREEDL